jgi:hypothetical protein
MSVRQGKSLQARTAIASVHAVGVGDVFFGVGGASGQQDAKAV